MVKTAIQQEKAQGLVEYALILVLVAIVVIGILLLLGPTVGNVFSDVVTNLLGRGVIISVSAVRDGTSDNVKVTITVSTNTSVTVRDSQSGQLWADVPCNGSCEVNMINVGFGEGTATVTAAAGGRATASYSATP